MLQTSVMIVAASSRALEHSPSQQAFFVCKITARFRSVQEKGSNLGDLLRISSLCHMWRYWMARVTNHGERPLLRSPWLVDPQMHESPSVDILDM